MDERFNIDDYDIMIRIPEEMNVGKLNKIVRELRERLHNSQVKVGELQYKIKYVKDFL